MAKIRRVSGAKQAPLLTDMHRKTFGAGEAFPNFTLGWWWIAYEGSEPVGFAGLARARSNIGYGYLVRTGVLPQHRGQGLQRRFVKLRERFARNEGMKGLITDTTDNVVSSNNLAASGFRLFTPRTPWAFRDSLYWKKDFSK